MKNFSREELSGILNKAPLTDESKKASVRALRHRNRTKLFSRIGIAMGAIMILGGAADLTRPADPDWLLIQLFVGPFIGIVFITYSLHSLRAIAAAKAMEELLILTANQSVDPAWTRPVESGGGQGGAGHSRYSF